MAAERQVDFSLYRFVSLYLVLPFMLSCKSSAFDVLKPLVVEELKFNVVVSQEVNQRSPVAVDLLVIYDQTLLDQILEMTAKDWFEQREQFQRDFPDGYKSWEWEWVPGQAVPPQKLPLHARRVKGGVLFADYSAPGAHRAPIDLRKPVTIVLGRDSFSLSNS